MADLMCTAEPARTATCIQCQASVLLRPKQRGPLPRWCSDACRTTWRSAAGLLPRDTGAISIRNCKKCGVDYTGPTWRRQCYDCGLAAYLSNLEEQKQKVKQGTCEHCGQGFKKTRAGGKAKRTGTRNGVYCSSQCHGAARTAEVKSRPRVERQPHALTCLHCFGPFVSFTALAKYCSELCRKRAASKASNEYQCRQCGASFPYKNTGGLPKQVCGPVCAAQRTNAHKRVNRLKRKALLRSVTVEAVDPIKVFVRDGWLCHLCGKPTLSAKRGTYHPKAPELDHIKPLACGGSHSYANTACAHRLCNAAKGAKDYGQPSFLLPR